MNRAAVKVLSQVVIVAACVFALFWLKQQDAALARTVAPAMTIFLMGYALFTTYTQQRRLDEVQIASQGFAHTHGWLGATFATVLLLMLPPVMNWLVDLVNMQSSGSPDPSGRGAVRLAFMYGACLMVVTQVVGVLVAAFIWWRSVGGMRERS